MATGRGLASWPAVSNEVASGDRERVDPSLQALEKLYTILADLEGVEASLGEAREDVDEDRSTGTALGVSLLVLLVIVLLMQGLVILGDRGPWVKIQRCHVLIETEGDGPGTPYTPGPGPPSALGDDSLVGTDGLR